MSNLSTLFVRNLIVSGVHGSTGRERFDPQRFQVDIDLSLDITRASSTDSIHDTYDYKDAAAIARDIIERERHVLIEKVATRIATRILENHKISEVKIMLRKLDAAQNGTPGIRTVLRRAPQELDGRIKDFDMQELLERIDRERGVSIPILTDSYRRRLLEEAETYVYEKQPEVVGAAQVREQLSSVYKLKPGSMFTDLRDDFQRVFNEKLERLGERPFATKLDLNETSLQLYEAGSIGITPHVDGKSCINLICVFILTGSAKFAFCDDRSGANPRYLDTTPGNLIIFRAPGFRDSDFRPFHFLSDVTERRIVFGLRQKAA